MVKRLQLLGGLAIVAVVLNHASHWGFIALFGWTDHYDATFIVNANWLTAFSYYALLVIRKLAVFSVPSFLYISGFFIAFAARGTQPVPSWKMLRKRIANLLWPYLIWSLIVFGLDALKGEVLSPPQYIARLIYGGTIPHYFFVPLLCQLYLLSPWLVRWAKTKPLHLLIGAAIAQLSVSSFWYWGLLGSSGIMNGMMVFLRHWSFFPQWLFFFAFGVVCGLNIEPLRRQLLRFKWLLGAATLLLGLFAIVEAEWVFRFSGQNWRDLALSLPSSLYAVSFVLCFLSFEQLQPPGAKLLAYLSNKTFGIYLIHSRVIEYFAWLFYLSIPWLIAYPLLLLLPLALVGLGVPVLMMEAVSRSPARRFFTHIFG